MTNSGKVMKTFSCPLKNSSKGKYRLKSTEGEETEVKLTNLKK